MQFASKEALTINILPSFPQKTVAIYYNVYTVKKGNIQIFQKLLNTGSEMTLISKKPTTSP